MTDASYQAHSSQMVRPKTIVRALTEASHRLASAGCDTAQLDAELLLAHTLGTDRTGLYRRFQELLGPEQKAQFEQQVARRVAREPVAYIVGHKSFFALDFLVTPHVLIPRPETELLVETALDLLPLEKRAAIVDVGTGSGCIAVTLARRLPRASVLAIDLSHQALAVARQNARRLATLTNLAFVQGDLLTAVGTAADLIVSNPPYIDPADLRPPVTSPEVNHYEPRLALAGGRAGLAVIERLVAQASLRLKPGGQLLVEIGAGQGPAVSQLAHRHFPRAGVEIKKDLAGLERLLVVHT